MTLTRLANTSSIFSIVYLTTILIIVFLVNGVIAKERLSSARQSAILDLGNQLMEISDYLTQEVRLYTIFGDTHHLDRYWKEINRDKRWNRIISKLRDLDVSPENLALIASVERSASKLQLAEKRAMLASQGNDLQFARELVFGETYIAEKLNVDKTIRQYHKRISSQADAELAKAKMRSDRLLSYLLIAHLSFFFLAIHVFFFILIKKITVPLAHISTSFTNLTFGDTAAEIPYRSVKNEMGTLARSAEAFKSKLIENQRITRELAEHKNNLERIVLERTGNLLKSNAELDEFSYRTSHDLRSPLISAIGLLDVVKLEITDGNAEIAIDGIDHALTSLCKLQNLVEDILVLTKINHMVEDDKVVNLDTFINAAIKNLEHMEGYSTIAISANINGNKEICTKPVQLNQILQNLISNAIKYQAPERDSYLKISTSVSQQNFEIIFVDNGIGIPKDQQENIFGMFKRFHPGVAQGSGLGLYLVQKSSHQLGGKIHYSQQNEGSCFTLCLPLSDR